MSSVPRRWIGLSRVVVGQSFGADVLNVPNAQAASIQAHALANLGLAHPAEPKPRSWRLEDTADATANSDPMLRIPVRFGGSQRPSIPSTANDCFWPKRIATAAAVAPSRNEHRPPPFPEGGR